MSAPSQLHCSYVLPLHPQLALLFHLPCARDIDVPHDVAHCPPGLRLNHGQGVEEELRPDVEETAMPLRWDKEDALEFNSQQKQSTQGIQS